MIGLETEADTAHSKTAQITFGASAEGAAAIVTYFESLLAITLID